LAKKELKAKREAGTDVSLAFLRRQARAAIKEGWEKVWVGEESREGMGRKARGLGTHYRRVTRGLISYNLKPSLPVLPRPNQSGYIQLKIGIGYLSSYLFKIGKRDNEECEGGCLQRQTTTHLVLKCTRYAEERRNMRKCLKGIPLTLQVLFTTTKGKEALGKFLCGTGICTAKWYQEDHENQHKKEHNRMQHIVRPGQ